MLLFLTQISSHPFAIERQILHRVFKGKSVLYIIKLLHKIKAFVLL